MLFKNIYICYIFIVIYECFFVFNIKMDYKENDFLEGNIKIILNFFYRNFGLIFYRLLNLIFNNYFSC